MNKIFISKTLSQEYENVIFAFAYFFHLGKYSRQKCSMYFYRKTNYFKFKICHKNIFPR